MLIYLDNATTSYPKPTLVYEAVSYALLNFVTPLRNGFSIFESSCFALEETRETLAKFFNIDNKDRFIFTPGGTYSIFNCLAGMNWKKDDIILTTPVEHNSVINAINYLEEKYGIKKEILSYLPGKGIDIDEMENKLVNNTVKLIVMSHASHVTGEILPLRKAIELARRYNAQIFLNSSQTVGVFPIDLKELDVDYMAFSCHKNLLGMAGVGALYVKQGLDITPLIKGHMEGKAGSLNNNITLPQKLEAGSLNLPSIWALNASLCYLRTIGLEKIYQHKREIARSVIETFNTIDGIKCYSYINNNAGIIAFNIKDKNPTEIAEKLDRDYSICIKSGFMGAKLLHPWLKTESRGCLRVSFSYYNTREELKPFINAVREIAK